MAILVIIGCLLFNAFLSGTEMAFVAVRKARLRELNRRGHSQAARILALRENPERVLSVLQVGITLVGVLAAAVGGAGAEDRLSPWLVSKYGFTERAAEVISVLAIVFPYTFISVVIGELVPKSLALRNPERLLLFGARPLVYIERVFRPLVSLLERSTYLVLRVIFRRREVARASLDNESLDLDTLSQEHRQYVLNLVNLRKRRLEDVLVPWAQVVKVDESASADDVAALVLASGHTRLPVMRQGIVIGMLNTKEFYALDSAGFGTWKSLVRPVVLARTTDSLLKVLREMQARHSHLSVVQRGPEYVGIVTMEDIFEEIVGDIFDEDDDGAVIRRIFGGLGRSRAG